LQQIVIVKMARRNVCFLLAGFLRVLVLYCHLCSF
jgi:hypothetical protein